jgi:hypothetical protein
MKRAVAIPHHRLGFGLGRAWSPIRKAEEVAPRNTPQLLVATAFFRSFASCRCACQREQAYQERFVTAGGYQYYANKKVPETPRCGRIDLVRPREKISRALQYPPELTTPTSCFPDRNATFGVFWNRLVSSLHRRQAHGTGSARYCCRVVSPNNWNRDLLPRETNTRCHRAAIKPNSS